MNNGNRRLELAWALTERIDRLRWGSERVSAEAVAYQTMVAAPA